MKYIKQLSLLSILLVLLSGCINVPIGDGNKIKIGKDGFTLTGADGDKHKVELSENEIIVKDEKTGKNKLELSEDGMTYTDVDGKEQKVTMEEKDGHVKIGGIGEDGQELSMMMGDDIEIPEKFPTDIPLTNDANVIMAMEQPEGMLVSFSTENPKDKVIEMYNRFAEKQKKIGELEESVMEDDDFFMKMYYFERDDGAVTINISTIDGENPEISIIYNPKED